MQHVRSITQAQPRASIVTDEQHRVVRGVVIALFVSLPVWLTLGSLVILR